MSSASEELLLEVTTREQGPLRLRVFTGFPVDFRAAQPLEGFEDADFPEAEWLDEAGSHPTIEALEPLLTGRPRVRLCYDPSVINGRAYRMTWLPLEEIFARRFGVSLVRHPLTAEGTLATPYAEEVAVPGRLKVLLVFANPDRFAAGSSFPHLPHLNEQFAVLAQALSGLAHQQLVFFETLTNERGDLTAAQIVERIEAFNPAVLIYCGHGYVGVSNKHGAGNGLRWGDLLAEETLPFAEIRRTLVAMSRSGEKPALRLFVPVACYSTKAGEQMQTPGTSEAEEDAREVQVPAVVGMYDRFPANAVAVFSAAFFGMLSSRQSVEAAFQKALGAMGESLNADVRYAQRLPRLWLTSSHSRLFPPSEESALGLYREKLMGLHGQVPFSNRNTTVPLNDLYVERAVVERTTGTEQGAAAFGESPVFEAAHMSRAAGRAAAPAEKVAQEKVQELRKELQSRHRVLLSAEARTGKSTLCQRLVLISGQAEFPWIPILIRFSEFAASRKGRQQKPLAAFLQENYAASLGLDRVSVLMGTGETAKEVPLGQWLYLKWEAGEALLIVDGLDEVFDDARRREALDAIPRSGEALDAIPRSGEAQARPRVLFTSRPFGNLLVRDAYVLHLKEFDKDAQIRKCADNCERLLAGFGSRVADGTQVTRFMTSLGEDARRKDLASRPGHLVELYVQFRTTGKMALFEEDLMAWVAQERFQVTDTARAQPPLAPNSATDRQKIMEAISFHMLFCRKAEPLTEDRVLEIILAAKANTQFRDLAETFIRNDLVRNSGFLRETRNEYGKAALVVESVPWLQFFAAGYLARQLDRKKAPLHDPLRKWVSGSSFTCSVCDDTPLPDFAHYLWRREWRDVVLLLAGQMEDATPLLARIQQEPEDLYHQMLTLSGHALRRAARVETDLVQKTCGKLERGWSAEGESREAVTRCLGRSKHDENLALFRAYLQACLEGKEWQVRLLAVEALGKIGHASAAPALLEILGSKDLELSTRSEIDCTTTGLSLA